MRDGMHGAACPAVLHLRPAGPEAVHAPVRTNTLPRYKAAAADPAHQLARTPVPRGMALFLPVRCAPCQFALHRVELLPRHDRFMVPAQIDLLLPSVVFHFPVVEEIRRAGLFLQQVAAIFLIAQQPQHHGG